MIAELFIAGLWGAFAMSIVFIFIDNGRDSKVHYRQGYMDGYTDAEEGKEAKIGTGARTEEERREKFSL